MIFKQFIYCPPNFQIPSNPLFHSQVSSEFSMKNMKLLSATSLRVCEVGAFDALLTFVFWPQCERAHPCSKKSVYDIFIMNLCYFMLVYACKGGNSM